MSVNSHSVKFIKAGACEYILVNGPRQQEICVEQTHAQIRSFAFRRYIVHIMLTHLSELYTCTYQVVALGNTLFKP